MALDLETSLEAVSLDDAVAMAYELATAKFPHLSDKVLNDFVGLLTYMAGDRKAMSLRELTNAVENFSVALAEGDIRMLTQPRGLRTTRIVDVQEFVESKFFLGQRGYVRPKVMEKLWELFHGENSDGNLEVVLGGGIGWGKSFFGEMALGYMLYKLSCFYTPQMEYGLAPGSSIYFVMQSIKLDLAKKVLFGQFGQRLKQSEYFSRYFPYNQKVSSELRFPNDINVIPLSSSDTSALGLNVFGGILDELNFMSVVERKTSAGTQEYDQAAKLYTTVVRRMRSRFNVRGHVPGKILLISSANYPGDFIDRKIHEYEADMATEGKSHVFVVRMAQWESLPKDRISEERFLVEIGNETRGSRMLKSMDEAIDPESVIEVPVDYKQDFEADLEAAIRDLAGIPVGSSGAFIKNRASIEHGAVTHDQLFAGRQFFSTSAVELSAFRTSSSLKSIISEEYLKLQTEDNISYFIHCDLALTGDSCGFAIGHFAGYKSVGKSFTWNEEMHRYEELPAGEEPVVIVDGVLEIVPPQADEIDINRIGDLIEVINSIVTIDIVTADSFQSAALLQRMRKIRNNRNRRIRSGVLSVDRTITPYTEVKRGLHDQRLIFPNIEKLKRELRELEIDPSGRKVDHPKGGSKDLADAMTGSSYLLFRRHMKRKPSGSTGMSILSSLSDEMNSSERASTRPRGSGRRLI